MQTRGTFVKLTISYDGLRLSAQETLKARKFFPRNIYRIDAARGAMNANGRSTERSLQMRDQQFMIHLMKFQARARQKTRGCPRKRAICVSVKYDR